MKAILLIIDGVSDRPVKELNYKTPLEVANKPNMDRIAKFGECGIMDPIAPGIRCGSDTSHLAILGYDPFKTYTGRGPFEALGIGMNILPGDVCFRCNFSTVDDNMVVLDRRAGRIKEGTKDLAKELNGLEIDGVKCFFKESVAHRGALILRGDNIGHNITDVDPHNEGVKIHQSEGLDEKSKKTADVLNKFVQMSYQILNSHSVNIERRKLGKPPANIILPRGGGIAPNLEKFNKKYNLNSACIVEIGLIKGIGKYLGMNVIDVEKATGGLDTDVLAIGNSVLENLKIHNFIFCNVKGCDIAGHDGDYNAKIKFIEEVDKMIELILKNIDEETYIILTSDHSTPVSIRDHSGDPVPIVFFGCGVRCDDIEKFDEISCAKGGLKRIRGFDLMNILLNLMNISEKFGA